MKLDRPRVAGLLYLVASLVHLQWSMGGPAFPLLAGSASIVALLDRGDIVGLSILSILVLGVVGGITTLLGWSYSFSSTCLLAAIGYFALLAPWGGPYLMFMGAYAASLAIVFLGRSQFEDGPKARTRWRQG